MDQVCFDLYMAEAQLIMRPDDEGLAQMVYQLRLKEARLRMATNEKVLWPLPNPVK